MQISSDRLLGCTSTLWLYTAIVRPITTYACVIWWESTLIGSHLSILNKLQRAACMSTTGCFSTTPTASLEVILGLLPMDLHIRYLADLTARRLTEERRWTRVRTSFRRILELEDAPDVQPIDTITYRTCLEDRYSTTIGTIRRIHRT